MERLTTNAPQSDGRPAKPVAPISVHPLTQIQRALGSRAGGRFIQAMLTVSQPGDQYEQEADRVAEQVMRMPDQATPAVVRPEGAPQISRLQRKCEQCEEEQIQRQPMDEKMEEEEEASLQTKEAAGQTPQVTPAVQAQVEGGRGVGQPLPGTVRAFFEPRFGHDFSRVRVHTDQPAERSAKAVNAQAYTTGPHIVFGAGYYSPETLDGRRLLAHELTHVVQQSGADRSRVGQGNEERGPIQNPPLLNVIQRQPYYEKSESEVVESVIEALQQSNNIAGLNVDPAFDILNRYPLSFQMRVLAELYERGYFHGLLGYLAPGTKANHKLIVAIRFTQCQKDPSLLAYEEILEAEMFLKYDVSLTSELKPMFECLERERVRHEKRREEERLRREKEKEDKRFADVFGPGSEFCSLKKGRMQWRLYPAESADGKGKKQRMQIKFTPFSSYWDKTVTFLQTFREEGGGRDTTKIDIGINREVFRPFYGVNWDQPMKKWVPSNEGQDIGFRSQPNSVADPAAYLFDEPFFFPPPHGRVFESVAVVPETGETLGALTWGVGAVPAYAQNPKCADKPSSDFQGSVEKFYTPKNPAPGHGRENYDVILDGFAPNDAALTADQKKQLDSIVAMAKEMIASSKADPEATKKHLVVGGFGDSMDNDPMAASEQRAQAVANYIVSKGVPNDTLNLRTYGATWARYEVSTKNAQEGRNRRVQIRLFYP